VTSPEFANFQLFAQYSAAAYCPNDNNSTGSAITCADDVCPLVEAAGATSVVEFITVLTDNQGFVAVDDTNELVVLSFRGTNTLQNYIDDVVFLQVPCDFGIGCLVHSGFYATWLDSQNVAVAGVTAAMAANPTYTLVITGHSLGAAIATIAGAYLRDSGFPCDIYTYGSPRVFNSVGADYVTNQVGGEYRVTHLDDPVAKLAPIILDYRHTSPEFWLYDGTAETVDYTISDIETCVGNHNISCNAGTGGFDVTAHLYYFDPISACAPNFSIKARDIDSRDVTTDNYANLEMYNSLDIAYASQLES